VAARSVFGPEYRAITVSTLTLLALAAFDGMSVTAALPEIGADLGVRLLPWVLTAFLLSSTVSMLAAGTIIDTFGVSRTYRATLVVFFLSSVVCTAAPNLPALVAARLVQGVGGGLVMATTIAVVGIAFPDALRPRAYAANSTVWGVMALAGPALAAVLVSVGSWRWIFAINLPLVAVAGWIGWNRLPTAVPRERVAFDARGLLLVAVFSTVTLLGLSELRWWSAVAVAGSALVVWLYWIHSGRVANPILERRYISTLPYAAMNAVPFLFFAGSLAVDAFVPLYVRGGLGRSSTVAAFAIAFLAIGWTVGSQIVSRLLDRVQNTTAMIGGFLLTLPAIVVAAVVLSDRTPLVVVFVLSFVQGLGIGTVTNATLSLLQRIAVPAEMGRASATHQFIRNLGGTLGTAMAGAVLFFVVDRRVGGVGPVRDLLAGADVAISEATRSAIADGFRAACVVAAVFTSVGLVFALVARRWIERNGNGVTPSP
jgi:MFS family permease